MSDYMRAALMAGCIPGDVDAFKPYAPGRMRLHKPVAEVAEWFIDEVVDPVFSWAIDEVIEPVMTVVSGVVESALDNPVKTIAQIAAIAFQQYWALPLIEGADVAAKGGDLGDVLEATAKAYIAGELGSMAGNAIGSYVTDAATAATYGVTQGSQQAIQLAAQEAGMNTASQLAGRVAGSAARSATTAAVLGQDVGKALVTGGVSAAVPAALGQIDGYSSLPPTVQAVLSQTITAGLLGGNVTNAAITSLITSANVAAGAVKNMGGTPAQQAIATDMINGTMIAALTGRNVSAAQQSVLMMAGANALGNAMTAGFKKASTDVGDKTAAAKATADKMDANIAKQETAAADYNKYATAANDIVAEQNRLKSAYDSALATHNANPSQATADAVNASAKAFNDYVTDANTRYSRDIKPGLDQANSTLAGLQNEFNMLEPAYAAGIKDIQTATTTLEKELAPVTQAVEKAVVTTLDPKFNEAQYKALNGVPDGENAFSHWLTKGQFENAVTNDATAEFYFSAEKTRLLLEMAEANGVSIAQINQQDTNKFFDAIESKYGSNLKALSSASLQDVLKYDRGFGKGSGTYATDHFLQSSRASNFAMGGAPTYGAWNATDSVRSGLPSGVQLASAADVANDRALLGYTADGRPVWLTDMGGGFALPQTEVGSVRYAKNPQTGEMEPIYYGGTLPEVVVTATRIKDEDPGAYVSTIGSMPDAATAGISDYLYNFAKNVMDLAKRSNNSTIINTAGNVLKAGGGVMQAFNGLVTLAGKNPTTTSVGKFADKLINLGKATTTEEYRAAVADMNQIMKGGKGVLGTAKAIWGAATSYPAEFLAEIVGVEAMQELVPLVIGGGAATAARGLAMAKGMGTTVAAQWSARAGISAGAASDIAESVGGAAEGAFNEAYKVAIARGMSEADATNTALQIAARTGIVSGIVTAGTLKIGGAALEKAIYGKAGSGELAGAIDALTATVKRGGSITLKEGVTEGIESGLTEAFKEGQLFQLDPTRDVSGNITSAVILGAVAGGGIAGGTYGAARTGDVVSNALITSNPQVMEAVNNSTAPAAAAAALQNLGISDLKVQANLLDTKYDSNYTSTAEARTAFAARSDYVPTDADIDSFVGGTSDAALAAKVDQYVDPRVFDINEVKAAAAAEGYNISDADAAKLVGQKDEAGATTAARQQFDPLATNTQEATQFFANLGYNPTTAEVQQFVGSKSEADQTKAVSDYVNPRQVTEAEAREYLTRNGLTNPTDAEVKQFVGQVNQDEQAKKIAEYADPRAVDAEEVKAAYAALGLEKPTTADIQKLVGQYAETDLSGKAKTNLEAARFNTLVERINEIDTGANPAVKAAIDLIKKDLGAQIDSVGERVSDLSKTIGSAANNPTQDDARQALKIIVDSGTYDAKYDWDGNGKVELSDAINMLKSAAGMDTDTPPSPNTPWNKPTGVYAGLDAVQRNVLTKVAEYEKAGATRDEAITKAVDAVAKDLGTTKEAISKQIGTPATKDASGKPVDATGVYKAIEDSAAATQKAVLDKVAEYEKAGVDRDKAITKAVDDVAKDLGTTKEVIGTPATKDANGKPVDATGVYKAIADSAAATQKAVLDKVAEYEQAGATRDEALGKAVADVAKDLGTTKEAINKQITDSAAATQKNILDKVAEYEAAGLSRDEATAKAVDAVAKDLGTTKEAVNKQIADSTALVQKTVLDKVAEYEQAGATRDEAITKAVDAVAKDLGTTKEAISKQIGTPATKDASGKPVDATGVYKAIEDSAASVQKNVLDKVAEYERAGATRDEAITKAVDAVAKDLGTTKEAISKQIGTPAAKDASGKPVDATGVYKAIADSASSVQKNVLDKMAEYEKAGLSRDEANAKAVEDVARDLGTTKEAISKQITDSTAAIKTDAQTKYDALNAGQKKIADDLVRQGADLTTAINTAVTSATTTIKAEVQTKYDALDAGQKKLADDLARQGVDLNAAIEAAAASVRTDARTKYEALDAGQKQLAADLVRQGSDLGGAIAAVESNVRADAQGKYDALTAGQKKIADDLVRQGATLTAAINTAVNTATADIKADAQVKYDALSAGQKKLTDDLVRQGVDLNTAIGTAQAELGGRITDLGAMVGTPGRGAGRTDLDEIINLLNTQGAYDPRYDYNANGRIDPEDRDAIANYLGGTASGPFTPGTGTVWAPSGIYSSMAQNQAALEKRITDEAEATRAANAARMDANARLAARSALKTQRMGNLNSMMGMMAQPNAMGGQRAPAAAPDPAKIGYVYDFGSIFANPAQEKMFVNPYGGYAQGGAVRSDMDDVNDELLKILKG